jgi:hypothetical protein
MNRKTHLDWPQKSTKEHKENHFKILSLCSLRSLVAHEQQLLNT